MKHVYLTISTGSSPATAHPLFASTDPDVVRTAMKAIFDKVESPDETVIHDPSAHVRSPRGR